MKSLPVQDPESTLDGRALALLGPASCESPDHFCGALAVDPGQKETGLRVASVRNVLVLHKDAPPPQLLL